MTAALTAPAISDLEGLPFLDDAFAASRLLALTVAVRYAAARNRGLTAGMSSAQAESWLGPARALMLSTAATPMPAQPLPADGRQQVTESLGQVAAVMPHWQLLLTIPIRYARLHPSRGAISASSRDWPQHVLLADEAFATARELAEQILHELAHQWLYLIEDLWPLHRPGAPALTLPSGTGDRSPAEILGAAHVAATLIRFYRQQPGDHAAARIAALAGYGTGCLELVGALSEHLTGEGTLIARKLKEAF
jgi:hypothetical protein